MNTTETNHKVDEQQMAIYTTSRQFEGLVPLDADILNIQSLGEALQLEYDRKQDFTEELASKILELKEFEGERKLRDTHVSYLINTMKRETFRPELVKLITCYCEEDDTEYRMNGQHTCWARLQMPKGYECPGKISVARYKAKTKQDMRLLYATIDRGAARTKANVINAHLAGTDQFADLNPTEIKVLSEGYSFFKWDGINERHKRDGDDISYLMQSEDANLVNSLVAYLKTFKITSHSWLRRAPVIAGMFFSFEKAVKVSGEFWDSVREGTGMTSKDDPRLKLRNALMTCTISRIGQPGSNTKKVSSEEIVRWCLAAWNAYRREEPLSVLKAMLSSPRPKAK